MRTIIITISKGDNGMANVKEHKENTETLKGTFFASVVFVGGSIIFWTGLLLVLYLLRY
ncbi:hypothetical protein [Macrococcoides caseolyticum]|uniref:hypothetical protein n=1 Tax=Macrococcoides caseolyticum TaxID=69966 RepID=UPI0012FEAE39|nr:hypothetical protein [Macrococcus caseolyticus]